MKIKDLNYQHSFFLSQKYSNFDIFMYDLLHK